MGLLHKLMPTRGGTQKPVKLITDLDLLVSQPIGFRYLGRDHVIEPMTTQNFIDVVKALHDIEVIASRSEDHPEFDQEEIYLAYHRFVSALCDSITLEDIKKAKLPQLHALMALLTKHIKGETTPDMMESESDASDSEKKKMK
jgi:hypothetical protein